MGYGKAIYTPRVPLRTVDSPHVAPLTPAILKVREYHV